MYRYDGFFTETPPSNSVSAIKSCFGPQNPTRAIYCCDPGYTTNFDFSYTGFIITGGPTNYFPQIPGLNTGSCQTTLLGGLTFVTETTIYQTTLVTVPLSNATATTTSGSVVQPASAIRTYFPTSTLGTPISTVVRTSTMTLFFPEPSVNASLVTSIYSFNETIIRVPTTTMSSSRSSSTTSTSVVVTTDTSAIAGGAGMTMVSGVTTSTGGGGGAGTTSAPTGSETGAGGTSAPTTSTVRSFGVVTFEIDLIVTIIFGMTMMYVVTVL